MQYQSLFAKNQPTFNRQQSSSSAIQRQTIRYWQEKYEKFLMLTRPKSSYQRYARALENFLSRFPNKQYPYDFLRPAVMDFLDQRMREGASLATIRLEIAVVRGFFQFMLDMEAPGALFNPAVGVRPTRPPQRPTTSSTGINLDPSVPTQ